MRSYLVLTMVFLYLIQYFTNISLLRNVVVIMALIAFLGSAPKADRLPRLLGLSMMAVGIGLELGKDTGMGGIREGLFLILPLVCLITLAPLLSIPLRFGGYFEAIAVLLRQLLNQPRKLYLGITSTLFFLSPVLNLGSVRIIHDFLDELKLPSMMSAKSYLVGFTTVSLVIPASFAFSRANREKMKPLLIDYRDRTVPMMNNEIMLFMSAGMLAFAIKGTPLAIGVNDGFLWLANQSVFLFALAVVVTVLAVTYIGIHQIAVVGALAMQLDPAQLGISSLSIALLLLLSWSVSTALSPFSGLNLMVSRFAGVNGIQTGIRANGLHMSLVSLIGVVIISIIG